MTLGAITSDAASQVTEQAEPSAVMRKLAAMAGEWRGTSWSLGPGGDTLRMASWEKVESKLGGLVLWVHGRHTSLMKADSGRVAHEAVAMMYYDGLNKQLRVVPVRFDGGTTETYAKETEQGMEWGFDIPGNFGKVRYRLDLSRPDVWIETGEFSRDGATWRQTIRLDLKRVN